MPTSRRIGTGGVPRRPQEGREHLWGAWYVLQRLHRNYHCVLLKKALLVFFLNKSVICLKDACYAWSGTLEEGLLKSHT